MELTEDGLPAVLSICVSEKVCVDEELGPVKDQEPSAVYASGVKPEMDNRKPRQTSSTGQLMELPQNRPRPGNIPFYLLKSNARLR